MTVYLDNSATTRPSEGVIAAVTASLSEGYFNPSSMYAPAFTVEKQLTACRDKIRKALSAPDARVIFTSGGTESNNLAITGTLCVSRPPYRVAVSGAEHPSVYDTAFLTEKSGAEVVSLPLDPDGRVNLDAVAEELKKGLTLLSVMQVNNETGAKNDIPAIWKLKETLCPACRMHVDGVQGFLREDMSLKYCDLYTLSSHKIHGPKGVGALVVKKGLRLAPSHTGGGQEDALRSGTENTPGIAGLSEAITEMLALPGRRDKLMALKLRLVNSIRENIPEAVVNGPAPEEGACHILSVSFPPVRGETMLHALEEKGVYVSTGSACSAKKKNASRVLTNMGLPAARTESVIRMSLNPYMTEEEIDYAVSAVTDCYNTLKKYTRR